MRSGGLTRAFRHARRIAPLVFASASGLVLLANKGVLAANLAPYPHVTAKSIVARVIVVCRVYDEGDRRVTEYCEDGYVCGDGKCNAGPEKRREQQAERARRRAELEKQKKDLEALGREVQKFRREANREVRRTLTTSTTYYSWQSTSGGGFDCNYKRAGDGAAWDAACMKDGVWPEGAKCNPSEVCPFDAVSDESDTPSGSNKQPQRPSQVSGGYRPGYWYTPSGDPRVMPTPRYSRSGRGPFGSRVHPSNSARQSSRTSLRDQLRKQMRYEPIIEELISLRDQSPRGSPQWQERNVVLRNLAHDLEDQGYQSTALAHDPELRGDAGKEKLPGGQADATPDAKSPANGDKPASNQDKPASDPPPPAESAPGALPPAPAPEGVAAKLPEDEDPLCHWVAEQVAKRDLNYSRISQVPEKCRSGYGIREALQRNEIASPAWSTFESDSRAEIDRMRRSAEYLAGMAHLPPDVAP